MVIKTRNVADFTILCKTPILHKHVVAIIEIGAGQFEEPIYVKFRERPKPSGAGVDAKYELVTVECGDRPKLERYLQSLDSALCFIGVDMRYEE